MRNILISVYVLFLIFIVGSAVFASRTFDGDIANAYEKGMKFHDDLKAIRQQGLQFRLGEHLVKEKEASIIELVMVDGNEDPLSGAVVDMTLSRLTGQYRHPQVRAAEHSLGHYQAEVVLPSYGLWQVEATIQHGDQIFNQNFRIYAEEKS